LKDLNGIKKILNAERHLSYRSIVEKLILATQNQGKLREIREFLSDLPIQVLSAGDFAGCPQSEEPHATYLENAREKARLTANFCGHWALADDSGLEVEALGGAPGVQSARFAGELVTYEDNNRKLLKELSGLPREQRRALFRCTMVLGHPDGREFVTEGNLEGFIREEPSGNSGFGYDPVFEASGQNRTLAEMSLEEKNSISHRTRALLKMKEVLKELLEKGAKRSTRL